MSKSEDERATRDEYARASGRAVYAHSALIAAQSAYDIAAEDERLAWRKVAAANKSNNKGTKR